MPLARVEAGEALNGSIPASSVIGGEGEKVGEREETVSYLGELGLRLGDGRRGSSARNREAAAW